MNFSPPAPSPLPPPRHAADIKPLNVVRVTEEQQHADADAVSGGPKPSKLKLIDLDASSVIGGFVGLKTSTGYAPPELLFRESPSIDSAASDAGIPGVTAALGGGGFRVRSVDDTGAPLFKVHGEFEPLRADVSFDIWGFGCVLYECALTWPGRRVSSLPHISALSGPL